MASVFRVPQTKKGTTPTINRQAVRCKSTKDLLKWKPGRSGDRLFLVQALVYFSSFSLCVAPATEYQTAERVQASSILSWTSGVVLWCILLGCWDLNFLLTNGLSIKPPKVKLLAGEQKASECVCGLQVGKLQETTQCSLGAKCLRWSEPCGSTGSFRASGQRCRRIFLGFRSR